MFRKFIQILALAMPLLLIACNSSTGATTGTDSNTSTTSTTTKGYAGSYAGSVSGVNAGPATLVVSSSNAVTGDWSITNRVDEIGNAVTYPVTFSGNVDANGKLSANAFLEGALVMIFSGQINSEGALTGTYYEAAHPGDPAKSGSFTLQGPKNGATTSTTTTGSAKSGCTGSFVGDYSAPDHETRVANRNRSLADRGIPVTGNDDIDNANAGGGAPDGGIWMAGSYSFETDANCNVVKGKTFIFYAYEYDISGTVNKDGTFALTWSGQGSVGDMKGKIEANNTISGDFFHPAPGNYINGVLGGTFTPNGKI